MPGKSGKPEKPSGKDKDTSSSEDDPAPEIGNVREYSDMILYFVRSGRFQYHSLKDYGRRKGVITLLKPQRVFYLTQERRLRPVVMQLTAGEVEQRVYLFALVRESLSEEDLDDIMARLNRHIDGLSTQEKEDEVISLIHNTRSRMIPGTRNLPFYLYDEGEEPPRTSNVDKEGRPIGDLSDERIVVKESKGEGTQRGKGYRSLPSTSANVREPITDSERSSVTSRASTSSKRSDRSNTSKTSDKDTMSDDVFDKDHGKEKTPETEPPRPVRDQQTGKEGEQDEPVFEDSQAPPTEADPDTTMTQGDDEPDGGQDQPDHERTLVHEEVPDPEADQTIAHLRSDDDPQQDIVQRLHSMVTTGSQSTPATSAGASAQGNISMPSVGSEGTINQDQLQTCLSDILQQLNNLNGLCQNIVAFQSGRIDANELAAATGVRPPDTSATSSRGATSGTQGRLRMPKYTPSTSTSSDEPPHVHEAESKLMRYFPINVFTPAMKWLLQQKPVRKYLYIEVMRRCYKGTPTNKPEPRIVYGEFYDYVISDRLGAHLGKSTGAPAGLQFGRFPFPQQLVDIAERNLASLHRDLLPLDTDASGVFVHRCNAAKRNYLMTSKYLNGAESMQLMAQRLYWERLDFYNHHKEMFPHIDDKDIPWSYDKEYKGVRKWSHAQGKIDDVNFKPSEEIPQDIEDRMFPGMSKGIPLWDMTVARALVRDLDQQPLAIPLLPPSVWNLVNAREQASKEQVAAAEAKAKEIKKRAELKKKRRRATYAKKHGGSSSRRGPHSDSESEEDSDGEDDEGDDHGEGGDHDSDSDPDDQGGPSGGRHGRSPKKRPRQDPSGGGGSSKHKGSPAKRKDQGASGKDQGASGKQRCTNEPVTVTREALFGNISDISSSPASDVVATTQGGQYVFVKADDAAATGEASVAPANAPVLIQPFGPGLATQQVMIPEENVPGPSWNVNDLLSQAISSGIGAEGLQMQANTTRESNVNTKYQVLIVDPNEAIPPTVQAGNLNVATSAQATVVTAPREQTPIQRYEMMEDELPELSTSSSSSNGARFSSDSNGNAASASSNSSGESQFGATSILKRMGPPTSVPWMAQTTSEAKKAKLAKKEARTKDQKQPKKK